MFRSAVATSLTLPRFVGFTENERTQVVRTVSTGDSVGCLADGSDQNKRRAHEIRSGRKRLARNLDPVPIVQCSFHRSALASGAFAVVACVS
jgi:hypothetical protein